MLELVKLALRITTNAFDDEIQMLINACMLELATITGIDTTDEDDLINLAVVTYCKAHFGENENRERLLAMFEVQKAQLQLCVAYRGENNG